ncbi:MAG: hypothetical protein EZS28_041763, partial [Streblomastix strix]
MTVQLNQLDFLKFRVLVEDRFMIGFDNQQTFDSLRDQYGGISPELQTIKNLRVKYNQEKTIVSIAMIPGRPKHTGLGPRIVEALQASPHISLRRLADTFQKDKKNN